MQYEESYYPRLLRWMEYAYLEYAVTSRQELC